MRFPRSSDNLWMRELIDAEVVRNNLDGLEIREGLDLLDTLLLNSEKVDASAWLEWLTTGRGLLRIASLHVDEAWLSDRRMAPARRRLLLDECILPLRESGGTWLCASIRGGDDFRQKWESEFGARVVLLAPTLAELKTIRQKYQGN
jgi:hypothetical protein